MGNTCIVSDIMKDVRITMDMNSSNKHLLDVRDTDTLEINDIIRKNIEPAAQDILIGAPTRLLGKGTEIGADTAIERISRAGGTMYAGRIELPSDFLRLITFQMEGWSYAVNNPISEDDPLYSICHSDYNGISGNPEKPVVAIVAGNDGNQTLEFFSCDAGTEQVSKGRYIKKPKILGINNEDAMHFDGFMAIDEEQILNSSFIGHNYSAILNTNTNMFVFTPKGTLDTPTTPTYYSNCIDGVKYNDIEHHTVQQEQLFIKDSTVYSYDEATGGLTAVADSITEYIDMPVQLYDMFINRIAYLSFRTLGDDNAMKRMLALNN